MAANDARLIVLATVLDRQPVTGYAVRKHLVDQGVEAWAGVSVASIYSVLGTLTKHGLLEELPDPTGVRANTRAYRATEAGRDAFQELWRSSVRTVDPSHPVAFHVAITLRGLVSPRDYRDGLAARLTTLEAMLAAPVPPLPTEVDDAARLWRALAETEAAWVRDMVARAPS